MTNPLSEIISLNRSFHELTLDADATDDTALARISGRRNAIYWTDLLREYRVILLSEAGAGKTTEIRNIAIELRSSGKPAFFVRIENVCHGFEDAFEEGSYEEFIEWAASGEEGWLFLDSVDESRLRDARDFERAMKKLGRSLARVLQQAHIIVTGRANAWRAKSDLQLCRDTIPYHPINKTAEETPSTAASKGVTPKAIKVNATWSTPFVIVALQDLNGAQVEAFLRAKNVKDIPAFRDAVERKEASPLTARPQDLAELVAFWNTHDRIGSRLELLQTSIEQRLKERDQNRADTHPIAINRLRPGARLVAAATILTREPAIRVPDGVENTKGISVKEILCGWDDQECSILLSRPIFDEGIYGTVRFHHRSVREYLTAEWLHKLIVDKASRGRIESLFFRSQYGIEVIVPTMRPVLPWLAILDERILSRVLDIAPEIVFEGGDPSQLPYIVRSKILRQICEQLAQPAHPRSTTDYSAVQRFANVDLTNDIKELLSQYEGEREVAWFLLRMIWQGEIVGAADAVKRLALISCNRHTRIAAFRALSTVCSCSDQEEVRQAFLVEDGELRRDWLAELVLDLPPTERSVNWLLAALARTASATEFQPDSLLSNLLQMISRWPVSLLPKLVHEIYALLIPQPGMNPHNMGFSERFNWLSQAVAKSVYLLIEARDLSCTESETLSFLCNFPRAARDNQHELHEMHFELQGQISKWPELNQGLFWHDVTATRLGRSGRVINFWEAGSYGRLWTFSAESFDAICADIDTRRLLDDKLVALSLAFTIFRETGQPDAWRIKLTSLVEGKPELKSALNQFFNPPPSGQQRRSELEENLRQRAEQQSTALVAKDREWRAYIDANVEELRDSSTPGTVSNVQYYLHGRMREHRDRSDKWSEANWESLIPEFGEPIAHAFRDSAMRFWRGYLPQLRSEGGEVNSVPFSVIFGLTGLLVESRNVSDWPSGLSHPEVERATRYALRELNGFPSWFPRLLAAYPQLVIKILAGEIDYELALDTESSEIVSPYVLSTVSSSGDWIWEQLAPFILTRLAKPPRCVANLRYMFNIVHGSSLDNTLIAELAAEKANATTNVPAAPMWFAMWVGVEPQAAIPVLAKRLAELGEDSEKIDFAVHFITTLMGGRLQGRSARHAYREVAYMKSLYLLMHKYVRRADDHERAGKGVYSPELRDDAQDAREALVAFIRETPGKDAFLALSEIARVHPVEAERPWMAFYAKGKATLDADLAAWLPRQVADFHAMLERTPSNHRELWDLAVDRLLDLKRDLEEGDSSIASILQLANQETDIRKYIGNWCRDCSCGRYTIPQEEELADAKRPDLRFHGIGFDGPVPAELKLAHKWTGPKLFERLEIQLCGDYLRDIRSSRGIFLLVHNGKGTRWQLPNGQKGTFANLIDALRNRWELLSLQFPGIEDISIIGIDLTKRGIDARTASKRGIGPSSF
jgi:hypothetical protein